MQRILLYGLFSMLTFTSSGQYYLRGEVKDEKNHPLPFVKIFVHSSRSFYFTDSPSGTFGINLKVGEDSLTLTLEGYETITVKADVNKRQVVVMKAAADMASKNLPKLISFTKDYNQSSAQQLFNGDESYFQLVENDYVKANQFPNTGYSLNVNKASYSNVRRFLRSNTVVPPDAVRIEELINYFNLKYHPPSDNRIFNVESQLTTCPWNTNKQLFFVNVSAKKLDIEKVPPGNFVFLIDVSGSMDLPNRLPLVKAAFQLFVRNLRPVDTVSIVTYGGFVQVWLPPTSGNEKEKILKSIEVLEADGDTPGESAIKIAYQLARTHFIKNGNNRVILATDGDFNVGQTSEKALDDLISNQKLSGVYLTCLGVGMGNLKDSKLQTLAKRGNGNYAYLDDIQEAERVLVKELTQTFYSVADDVFMNVKFNPEAVDEYRLIGFDNKKEAMADSAKHLEGGEVGSGSTVMAVFEIKPNASTSAQKTDKLADLVLSYSLNRDSIVREVKSIANTESIAFENADKEIQFATAVTMFALKLKKSPFADGISWDTIKTIATQSANQSFYIQSEFVSMVKIAMKLYGGRKKWKW